MPLGKAWIYEDGDWAMAQLNLNLDTQAGKDWHATLKFDLAKGDPVQEWSYGYQVLDADFQVRGEQRVQVLKRLDVDEVSPVIRGAGNGTGTISIKSAELKEQHFAPLIAGLGELAERAAGRSGGDLGDRPQAARGDRARDRRRLAPMRELAPRKERSPSTRRSPASCSCRRANLCRTSGHRPTPQPQGGPPSAAAVIGPVS
jgi:hypothetical protein